jgi:hypothetical protein
MTRTTASTNSVPLAGRANLVLTSKAMFRSLGAVWVNSPGLVKAR